MGNLSCTKLTSVAAEVPQLWPWIPTHCFTVSGSTSHRATVAGQFPPRLDTVLSSVIYVPPMSGSLTLALKDIIATYMLYTVTWKTISTKAWLDFYSKHPALSSRTGIRTFFFAPESTYKKSQFISFLSHYIKRIFQASGC